PVSPGWQQVTEKTVYTADNGYGWLAEADESFDAPAIFIPDHLEEYVSYRPKPGNMERDGVIGKEDMIFRVDLPDGKYWIAVTIGSELRSRENMSIYLDGEVLAENETTRTSWGGYATYKTFRKPIQIRGGKIEITFKHKAEGNSVLGMELVPYVPYEISFADGRWQSKIPDANLQKGLKALNNNEWEKARELFEKISNIPLKATALAILADFLEVPPDKARAILTEAVQIADKIIQSGPKTREACFAHEFKRVTTCYLKSRHMLNLSGYMRAFEETGFNYARRMKMAMVWLGQINEEEPLYNRACLNLGRLHYWFAREGGSVENQQLADKYFGILKERQPDNRLVRMYTGEEIPWGEEFTVGIEGMPEWAVKQREAMGRLMAVLHWWINNRQLDNGELGGGFGDDVEMLRQWHVYLSGADDATIKRGWKKIAHGVWFSRVIRQLGYAKWVSDVQHSAEPMSDSHPALIGLDYGNPVWIERCLATMRLMRDYWTGINERGHRHFRCMWFGAKELGQDKKWAVDVPCCGRATRPGLWIGWYQRNPAVIKLFREWMDAWAEDIMREEEGKPAGIMPAAVSFQEDKIGGYGKNWYDPDLYWSYFKYPGYMDLIYDHLLAVYDWTGDEKYLKPIEAALDMAMEIMADPPKESPEEGSRAWAASVLHARMPRTAAKYRLFTGNTKYDEYLKKKGSNYVKFLLTGDKKPLIEGCESAAAQARNNFEFKTTEVLWTDRVSVSQEPMWGMFTGGVDVAYYYPSYAVTWNNTSPHFAALVTRGDKKSLKVLTCNFEEQTRQVQMKMWRLEPGSYELTAGPDANNDDLMDEVNDRRLFDITERGMPITLSIPARSVLVVEVSQPEDSQKCVTELIDRPDLAVGDQDILVGIKKDQSVDLNNYIRPDQEVKVELADVIPITVIVHNIGGRDVELVRVKLLQYQQDKYIDIAQTDISSFKALNDLDPQKKVVEFKWSPGKVGEYKLQVLVLPIPFQSEITRTNDTYTRVVRVVK
ncbi:MAG: hypothetical protein JSV03_05875, partial [Planctomycetota bacterium]